MEASNIVAYTIGYTAGPNWSNVACVCVRMWGKKTRPKTRPLGDKTRPIGTLLMHSTHVLSSPLLSSPQYKPHHRSKGYSSLNPFAPSV